MGTHYHTQLTGRVSTSLGARAVRQDPADKTEIHAKEPEDATKGIYYPFSVVLREEGGKEDGAAVVAANNYCKKCIT